MTRLARLFLTSFLLAWRGIGKGLLRQVLLNYNVTPRHTNQHNRVTRLLRVTVEYARHPFQYSRGQHDAHVDQEP